MSAEHNHPPHCCCVSAGDVYVTGACPACPEHGALAATPPINLTHPVGRRSQPGVHHALDCPRRYGPSPDCVCGREGERDDPATPHTEQETTKVEERPDDDPAPVATCNGRDCGGRPHE